MQMVLERDGEKMLKRLSISVAFVLGCWCFLRLSGQRAVGNSGSIDGVVKDRPAEWLLRDR